MWGDDIEVGSCQCLSQYWKWKKKIESIPGYSYQFSTEFLEIHEERQVVLDDDMVLKRMSRTGIVLEIAVA